MDLLSKILNLKTIGKIYFITTLVFITQLFNLYSLDLSNFKDFFVFKYLNIYHIDIKNIFYAMAIFNFYYGILVFFKPIFNYIFSILKYFFKFEYDENSTNFNIEILTSNIMSLQIFIIELCFILYKFKLLNFYIIDYSFIFNSDELVYQFEFYSINDYIYFLYILLILIIIQPFSFIRIIRSF